MPKIFLTGATGYVGGEVLYRLMHPGTTKYQVTCLVRDEIKASSVRQAYPAVRIALGDLDNTTLIENESANADIVLSLASTKHGASSEAIAKGLNTSTRRFPGHWIQISGASLFSGSDVRANSYGESGGKTYDDILDQDEIWSIVSQTPSRVVEQLILAQDPRKVKTALLVGPLIYGIGRGPVNTRSIQAPDIAKYTLQNGSAFQVGKGESVWSNVHVRDLSDLIAKLVDAAESNTTEIWNRDGIFCPASSSMSFGKLADLISKSAYDQGLVQKLDVQSFDVEKSNQVMGHGAILLGTNAKQTASRAARYLSWTSSEPSLEHTISEMVRLEVDRLQQKS